MKLSCYFGSCAKRAEGVIVVQLPDKPSGASRRVARRQTDRRVRDDPVREARNAESGSGVIVNLISGSKRDEGNEAALSRSAASELNRHSIRVYATAEVRDRIVEQVLALIAEE